MKKEHVEFFINLLTSLEVGVVLFGKTYFSFTIDEERGGEYYSINIVAKKANAEFRDCVIFYTDEEFNGDTVIGEVEAMINKAKGLLV